MVAAVILGWNPNGWSGWNYRAVVERVAESGRFLASWSVGHNRNIVTGTEVWLLLQGSSDARAGLIGHGVVLSEPSAAVGSGDADATGWYATVAFDALLPLGEQIRYDALSTAVPAVPWGDAKSCTGLAVPREAEPNLRQLWRDQGPVAMEPMQLVAGTYPPHAVSTIDMNRYERNFDARRVCLAFHGTSCAACGFSFEASYGKIGTGFIDVHHVVPPVMLGDGYQLDPIADLVPLCPNCHAMAHRGVASPRTVSELRNIISSSGPLKGEEVSELALEAQEDARRILDGRRD